MHTDIRGWTLAGNVDDEQFTRLLDCAQLRLNRRHLIAAASAA